MQHYFFDLFSSREVQHDLIGDDFVDLSEARKMARVTLLDYAQHCFPNGEECLVVCKVRTASPERYYLTSLALLDEAVTAAGYNSSIHEQVSTGSFDEGEVAYRMSPDWTDMRELRSDGFLKNVSRGRQILVHGLHSPRRAPAGCRRDRSRHSAPGALQP